ncbi:transmembrane protein, putative (macronuclear) [Tetrahymena thermophila SB210]|uniref:Transmembrane protein, putative n=1 Tax=Tetrahymena thermophila (strain SB210) TaxID=312017 RepID=W7WXE9_TETTS|nr:transmembrane protein, putative [Tetrahymena thermophila SB210]EWS71480.1 transmembrane protein, putative [Tetrahymena thermophila SB210]|eukprot:XP_012655983.1 transmembrane protein, putative [Tetrahymena thermophila SB210]
MYKKQTKKQNFIFYFHLLRFFLFFIIIFQFFIVIKLEMKVFHAQVLLYHNVLNYLLLYSTQSIIILVIEQNRNTRTYKCTQNTTQNQFLICIFIYIFCFLFI